MTLKVGDTVWLFDGNNRHYAKDGSSSGPIYRKHFVERKIVGENRASWLLQFDMKIDKRTMQLRPPSPGGFYGWSRTIYLSPQDVEDAVFVYENKHRISEGVQDCGNANVLRTIDGILSANT